MHLHLDDLVLSSRARPIRDTRRYIRIWRGIYLPIDCISEDTPPWRIRRLVSEARALAMTPILGNDNPPVLTGEAALALRGIDTWWNTPDIMLRRRDHQTHRHIREFAAVTVHGVFVPPAKIVEIAKFPGDSAPDPVSGVLLEPLPVAAADCAIRLHPLAATVAISGILRTLSNFDRRHLSQSRAAETAARKHLLASLHEMAPQRSHSRARAVVEIADAGIESPGEGALLWATHCVLHRQGTDTDQVVTQQPVKVSGQTFYGDIGLPTRKVIMEFDGYAKVSGADREMQFITRQRMILAAGWKVIRVELRQLLEPNRFLRQLITALREANVPASAPSGPLWVPIPLDLMELRRRG